MEQDRNIYVNYEKYDEKGNVTEPYSIYWAGHFYDLTKISKDEVFDEIASLDSNFVSDYNEGKIIRVNRYMPIEDLLKEEDVKKVVSIAEAKDKNFSKKMRFISYATALSIIFATVTGCALAKKNEEVDEEETSDLVQEETEDEVVTEAKEAVAKNMDNFKTLATKYNVDCKEFFISAQEWLTGYLYLNSYDYSIQELAEILKDNPDFYTNMSSNYRNFCKTQLEYNIVADETLLSREFFKDSNEYSIYMTYYNAFKEAKNDPTKENKQVLEDLTKKVFGLTSSESGVNSIYEQHPGVASIIGHTITTSAKLLNLISKETYDNAMGIYNYDKDGNLLETHGPIEMVTCERIEIERFNKLNAVVMLSEVKEDILLDWFNELNSKYATINPITEEEFFNYLNKKLEEQYHKKYGKNTTKKQTSTTNTTTSTKHLTGAEALEGATKEEIAHAEEEAREEFEEEYEDEIAQQEAKKQGLLDANNAIESILANARKNKQTADSYSSSDITSIGNSLVNSYNGKYKSYYESGVKSAVSSGISELNSIKSQYAAYDEKHKEDDKTEEVKEEISPKEEEKHDDFVPTPTDEIIEEEINDFVSTPTGDVIEEYISQEELDEEIPMVRVK